MNRTNEEDSCMNRTKVLGQNRQARWVRIGGTQVNNDPGFPSRSFPALFFTKKLSELSFVGRMSACEKCGLLPVAARRK